MGDFPMGEPILGNVEQIPGNVEPIAGSADGGGEQGPGIPANVREADEDPASRPTCVNTQQEAGPSGLNLNEKRPKGGHSGKRRNTAGKLLKLFSLQNAEMTPANRRLCTELLATYRKLKILRRKNTSLAKLAKDKDLHTILQHIDVSLMLKTVLLADVRNRKRKRTGRRWTLDEKLTALAIFKRSATVYRYLNAYLYLPSVRTLQRLLHSIPLKPGINRRTISLLARESKEMIPEDRQVLVMFDEMYLEESLELDPSSGMVDGFEDLGDGIRTEKVADHALVIMVQGLRRRYKQPVAHYFVRHSISVTSLTSIIVKVITAIQSAGLNVAATVCDQGSTNVKTMKKLIAQSGRAEDGYWFTVNGKKIFVLFDIPHLFKCLRNNFMSAVSVEWPIISEREIDRSAGTGPEQRFKVGRWSHIVKASEYDQRFFRMHRLTKNHIRPKGMAKMKVKYAAQTLSARTASQLRVLGLDDQSRFHVPGALGTSDIVADFDKLFDDCNGSSFKSDKPRRCNVSATSKHLEHWRHWIPKLRSMRFNYWDPKKKVIVTRRPPFVDNFILTLNSFEGLWNELHQKYNFTFLNLRQLDQDPIENLFGVLRGYLGYHDNPTVRNLEACLKTAIVTSLSSAKTRGTNCEQDDGEILSDLRAFVRKQVEDVEDDTPEDITSDTFEVDVDMPMVGTVDSVDTDSIEEQAPVYVAGYIGDRILSKIPCDVCRRSCTVDVPGPEHQYVQQREYEGGAQSSLVYASRELVRSVEIAKEVFLAQVAPQLHSPHLSTLAGTLLGLHVDTPWATCVEHGIQARQAMFDVLVPFLIHIECKRRMERLKSSAEEAKSAREAREKTRDRGTSSTLRT